MNKEITDQTSIAEIVISYPQTRMLFEQLGIDYCCGGKRSLEEASNTAGLSVQEIKLKLQKALEESKNTNSNQNKVAEKAPAELVDYIIKEHHTFLKRQLPRLKNLREKVYHAHKLKHGPMLEDLGKNLEKLRIDIELHLAKEEQILFPLIKQMEAYVNGQAPKPQMQCVSIRNPVKQMEYEHEVAGGLLADIKKITSEYNPPADACESFKALYEGLNELEDDLHEHIHLENNLLFTKAEELENKLGV